MEIIFRMCHTDVTFKQLFNPFLTSRLVHPYHLDDFHFVASQLGLHHLHMFPKHVSSLKRVKT